MMRWLLAPFRAVMFSAHVILGVAIVLVIFPFAGQVARNRINRMWSRVLIALTGARVTAAGLRIAPNLQRDGIDPLTPGRLALANHVRGWTFLRSMRCFQAALSRRPRSESGRCSASWYRAAERYISNAGGATQWRQ